HRANAEFLWAGLEEMGMQMHVAHEVRLPTLTTVRVPDGVDEAAVRSRLMNEFNLEIAGGLGALKGQVWRVGLMGYSSQHRNVTLFLGALREVLAG
ncbi:MAG: alanine--glyoxylate aminotransferase family protein, partial [Anaerolineae bacterium]|nr:alanine--glyoxylate aminotransferase family protein [Anaerolineae bacterium]